MKIQRKCRTEWTIHTLKNIFLFYSRLVQRRWNIFTFLFVDRLSCVFLWFSWNSFRIVVQHCTVDQPKPARYMQAVDDWWKSIHTNTTHHLMQFLFSSLHEQFAVKYIIQVRREMYEIMKSIVVWSAQLL